MTRPLAGRRVVTTRGEPGRLDSLLADAGAEVVHVPLIEIADATAPGTGAAALAAAVERLGDGGWAIVTSVHGARRLGPLVARRPCRLAAVGSRTASELARFAGRPVEVVPGRQTAADLAAAMPPAAADDAVVVAQADRADTALVEGLRAKGYAVVAITAYETRLRSPSDSERGAALMADALTLASGSAARSWVDAIGRDVPRRVVAIGPTTAAVAAEMGLEVTDVAAEHSVEGLVAAVIAALT